MTLNEQAKQQKWGPTIDEPKTEIEALEYALSVLGGRDRPCSLGEVYAIKSLQWLLERKRPMIAFLRQIVTFERVVNDYTVIHAVFKEDFGTWRKGQVCEVLEIVVRESGKIWLQEFCAALCVNKAQITLGVVA